MTPAFSILSNRLWTIFFTSILFLSLGVSDASAVQAYTPRSAKLNKHVLKKSSSLYPKRLEAKQPKRAQLGKSNIKRPYRLKNVRQTGSLVKKHR